MVGVSVSSNQRERVMPKHAPVLFDAADTSSFTLSGQRENIEGVEVGCGK
jgi:hypothetical protein